MSVARKGKYFRFMRVFLLLFWIAKEILTLAGIFHKLKRVNL
jgi:hypothetical protein